MMSEEGGDSCLFFCLHCMQLGAESTELLPLI